MFKKNTNLSYYDANFRWQSRYLIWNVIICEKFRGSKCQYWWFLSATRVLAVVNVQFKTLCTFTLTFLLYSLMAEELWWLSGKFPHRTVLSYPSKEAIRVFVLSTVLLWIGVTRLKVETAKDKLVANTSWGCCCWTIFLWCSGRVQAS